jgi:hypothetical protein
MTIVAAFRSHGVPILVSDLLITADTQTEQKSFLPTAPAAASSLSKDIRAKIVGTRKKVHLFGGVIAVAWSGSWLAASSVLNDFHNFSKNKTINGDMFKNFLVQQTIWLDENLTVILTGWIIQPEPVCFRWNSSWPNEIYFDERFFDGSGDETFETLQAIIRRMR